jgi:hypothetical protein
MSEMKMISEEEFENMQEQREEEHVLPPYPVPFRPWTDTDVRYTGSLENYRERIHYKLYTLWAFWGLLRTNKKLEALVARVEQDKEGDAYTAKNVIVDILDQLAKILSDSPLMDEIAWLVLNEEEFEKRKANIAALAAEQENEKLVKEKEQ